MVLGSTARPRRGHRAERPRRVGRGTWNNRVEVILAGGPMEGCALRICAGLARDSGREDPHPDRPSAPGQRSCPEVPQSATDRRRASDLVPSMPAAATAGVVVSVGPMGVLDPVHGCARAPRRNHGELRRLGGSRRRRHPGRTRRGTRRTGAPRRTRPRDTRRHAVVYVRCGRGVGRRAAARAQDAFLAGLAFTVAATRAFRSGRGRPDVGAALRRVRRPRGCREPHLRPPRGGRPSTAPPEPRRPLRHGSERRICTAQWGRTGTPP